MAKDRNISHLLNKSGNLTLEAMEAYLGGTLSAEDKAFVEQHLEESDFDREALEGLAAIKDQKKRAAHVHSINSMIDRRVKERGSSRNLRLSPAYLAVASVIILLAVISMVLYFPKPNTDLMAVSEQPKTETPEAKGTHQPQHTPSTIQPKTIKPITIKPFNHYSHHRKLANSHLRPLMKNPRSQIPKSAKHPSNSSPSTKKLRSLLKKTQNN